MLPLVSSRDSAQARLGSIDPGLRASRALTSIACSLLYARSTSREVAKRCWSKADVVLSKLCIPVYNAACALDLCCHSIAGYSASPKRDRSEILSSWLAAAACAQDNMSQALELVALVAALRTGTAAAVVSFRICNTFR